MLTDSTIFQNMKYNDLVSLECKTCQQEFKRKKGRVKLVITKKMKKDTFDYCSTKCMHKGQTFPKIIQPCFNCKKEFESRINEKRKFCSQSCAAHLQQHKS